MMWVECGPFSYLESSLGEYVASQPPGPGRRVGVITSSQRMAERLQRLLVLERGLALFNLRFQTLHGLSLEVLGEAGTVLPAVNNDDLFHERLVERLLLEEGMDPARARALAGAHRATLRDLLEAGVDGASFRDHFADLELAGREKLNRLLSLADRYRDRLEKLHVAGSADLARRAADVLDDHPNALSGYDELLYYGFYDLNGAQSDFFNAVVRSVPVRLYFPCVKGRSGWGFAERFLELKLPLGGAHLTFGGAPAHGALGPMEDRLFDPGRSAEPPGGMVRIINVSGERDEVWRVAKEIVRLKEEQPSLDWDDIGVVARGLDGYAGLVPDLFAVHGIPYSISDGGPLLDLPVARWAFLLAEISQRGHDRNALSDLLSSSLLRTDAFPPDVLREARDYVRRAGPRAGLFHLLSPSAPGTPPSLKELARRLSSDFPDGTASWSEHGASLKRRMGDLLNPDEAIGKEAVAAVLDRLSELDRFSPPVSEREFSSTFGEALRRSRKEGTGATHGVRVRGAMDARGESFRVLFLMGLKEGVFPRVVREDPLLHDDLRRFLRDPGGYWILPKLEGHDEEKLLFTLLVSSAREKLYLLYSRSGEDGRTEVPSLYVRRLARAVGVDLETAERLPRPPLEKWRALSPLLTPSEAAVADVLEGRFPPGPRGDAARWAKQVAGWGPPGPWDGNVGVPTAFLERCGTRGLSPSAVETLASCPFEFFLSNVLSLREPSSLYDEDGPLPAALGALQHDLLRGIYAEFLEKGMPDPDTAARWVNLSVDAYFASPPPGAGPYPLVWQAVGDRVRRRLGEFVRRDVDRLRSEGARPEKLEWALKGPLPGTPFLWSGRVDRVDWSPVDRRWTVVDYKNTKRKEPLLKRVLEGQVFQAPAYLELVEAQNEWGPGAASAGVRYESLATNESDVLTAEEWTNHRSAIEKQRADLLSTLRNGTFFIRPTEGPGAHCGYCDFARACRKAHGPSRKRAETGRGSS